MAAVAEEAEASASRKKMRVTLPLEPVSEEEEEEEEESQSDGEHAESDGEEEEEEEGSAGVEEEGSHQPASAAALADVTVADADALECGVCFLPLKPPIFQCELGHVVCSPCRDELEAADKCHVCGIATRGYRRCHAMEILVESIRVRCPYAPNGCAAMPAYHELEGHHRMCRHAPCRCPGEACFFVGSTAELMDHFAGTHGWPCATEVRAGEMFTVCLCNGFNFLLVDHAATAVASDSQDTTSSVPCVFLLKVAPVPLGRAISVLCIHPHATATAATTISGTDGADRPPYSVYQCELIFARYSGELCQRYYQSSQFQIVCSNLLNGLPNPDASFQFLVPNSALGDYYKDAILVKARITIN